MYEGHIKITSEHKQVDDTTDSVVKLGKAGEKSAKEVGKLKQPLSDLKGVGGPIGNTASRIEDLGSRAVSATRGVSGLAGAVGGVTVGLTAVAAAGVAAYAGIQFIGFKMAELADAADEAAQKLGLTIPQFEAVSLLARENATSVEALQRTYDKLSKSMTKMDEDNEKTAHSFEVLQIKQSELANKTEQEVAGIIIKRWEELGRTTAATTAVMQTLGPAFREQIPAIKAAADGMEDYHDRVRKYGAAATEDLVKKGGEQEKAMEDLGLAWKGLGNAVAYWSDDMIKGSISWAAEMIKNARDVITAWQEAQRVSAARQGSVSNKRRSELQKQAEKEVFVPGATDKDFGDVAKRYQELLMQEQNSNFRKFELGQSEQTYADIAEAERLAKLKKDSANVKPLGKKGDKPKDPAEEYMKTGEYKEAMRIAQERSAMRQDEERSIAEHYARLRESENTLTAEARKNHDQKIAMFKEIADPAAKARKSMEELNAAFAAGEVNIQQYNAAASVFQAEIDAATVSVAKLSEPVSYTTFTDGWNYAFSEFSKDASNAAQHGADVFAITYESLADGLATTLAGGKADWKGYADFVVKEITRILIKQALLKIVGFAMGFNSSANTSTGLNLPAGAGNSVDLVNGGVYAAGGTPPMGKISLVGEKGPELFVPHTAGKIIPNNKLGGRASNVIPITNNISVSIGSVDSEERQHALMKEMKQTIDVSVKQGIAEQMRRGNMLNPVR